MAGSSACGSSTRCVCCRSLGDKHGLLHTLCNYDDHNSPEQTYEISEPVLAPNEHVTTEPQDKSIPLTRNPCFTSIVTKCQIQKPFSLNVPISLYKLLPDECVPVVLSYQDKNWEMWYAGQYSIKRLYRGFENFAVDNKLKIGDSCVYELVDIKILKFRVQIFSRNIPKEVKVKMPERDENPTHEDLSDGRVKKRNHVTFDKADAVPSVKRVKIVPLTGDRYFTSMVSKCQVERPFQLPVPMWFSKFLPTVSAPVILTHENRSWEVWYSGHTETKRFFRGWKQFADDNKLQQGDGCVYELIDTEILTFKVQILRESLPFELDEIDYGNTSMELASDEMHDTGNPRFTSVITKSHLKRPFQMEIPRRFIPLLPNSSAPVVLTHQNKSWEMTYTGDKEKKTIRCGFKEFTTDNDLKIGDSCVYELTDKQNLGFNVEIRRGGVRSEGVRQVIGKTPDTAMVID